LPQEAARQERLAAWVDERVPHLAAPSEVQQDERVT
jgi:hypothetical protein